MHMQPKYSSALTTRKAITCESVHSGKAEIEISVLQTNSG